MFIKCLYIKIGLKRVFLVYKKKKSLSHALQVFHKVGFLGLLANCIKFDSLCTSHAFFLKGYLFSCSFSLNCWILQIFGLIALRVL